MVRKTRVSMTESVLVTWERDTLPPGHDCVSGGAKRAHRAAYHYENGSEVVVGGMDNSDRIMSTEYDLVCFFEATELTLEDFEKATSRLRNHMVPHPESSHPRDLLTEGKPDVKKIREAFASGRYPDGLYKDGSSLFLEQAICDCNPGSLHHWLNMRPKDDEKEGPREGLPKMTRLLSRHEDNPTVTSAYLQKLRNLTGPRRKRLYEGLWVTAEGMIYENWDPYVHIIDAQLTQSRKTKRWHLWVPAWSTDPDLGEDPNVELTWFSASMDWGFRAPGVLQVWGQDRKGRTFLVYEHMRPQKNKEWWANLAEEKRKKFDIQRFACDPAEPATIDMFNDRMGKVGGYWICQGVENDFIAGTDVFRQRLENRTMFFLRSAPDEAHGDPAYEEFKDSRKPRSLIEEIPGYVYAETKDGQMIREMAAKDSDDHALDSARYHTMFIDGNDWQPDKIDDSFPVGSYGAMMKHGDVEFT